MLDGILEKPFDKIWRYSVKFLNGIQKLIFVENLDEKLMIFGDIAYVTTVEISRETSGVIPSYTPAVISDEILQEKKTN